MARAMPKNSAEILVSVLDLYQSEMGRNMLKGCFGNTQSALAQIKLCICAAGSEHLLFAHCVWTLRNLQAKNKGFS